MENEKKNASPKFLVGGIAEGNIVEPFLKFLEETDQKLEAHIIAYLDFLGTKERIETGEGYKSLQTIKLLTFDTQFVADKISSINGISDFNIKLFSDNVVISLKLDKDKVCSQIFSLVNLIVSIQFAALMQFGFWLRGGITVGELSIDNSIVWGAGLIEAYNIENSIANYPRVIVDEKVMGLYKSGNNKSVLNIESLIKRDKDGMLFLDFLYAAEHKPYSTVIISA